MIAESAIEFLIPGIGAASAVGKAVGGATKGLNWAAKVANSAAKGISATGKGTQLAKAGITSAWMGQAIGALNAVQTFDAQYNYIGSQTKPDGTSYSDDEKRAIASRAAATSYGMAASASTLLNVTSLGMLTRPGAFAGTLGKMDKAINTMGKFKDQLAKYAANPKTLANGDKTLSLWQKATGSHVSALIREAGQEGVEEVWENTSQRAGMQQAYAEIGQTAEIDLMSEENALAFTLGAFGGVAIGGVGTISQARRKDDDAPFKNYVKHQQEAITKHEAYYNTLQRIAGTDTSKLSPQEFAKVIQEEIAAKAGMMSNAISSGIDSNTIMFMKGDLQSQIDMDPVEAEANGIDQKMASTLLQKIEKHQELSESSFLTNASPDAKFHALNSSLNKSMYEDVAIQQNERFNKSLTAFSPDKQADISRVNKLDALNEIESEGATLTDNQKQLKTLLEQETESLSEEEKSEIGRAHV